MSEIEICIDLKPALDAQTLDKRILRDFEKYKNKMLIHALELCIRDRYNGNIEIKRRELVL